MYLPVLLNLPVQTFHFTLQQDLSAAQQLVQGSLVYSPKAEFTLVLLKLENICELINGKSLSNKGVGHDGTIKNL